MKISFHGAAKTVTGSKHLITLKTGKKYLLDCGMFQGLGKETDELNRHWGFEPASIDFLILSHAHIDHSGLIPKLVKDGFEGTIFCTPATRELVTILLEDSAEIQGSELRNGNKKPQSEENMLSEALYNLNDVKSSLALIRDVEYDTWLRIDDQVELMFTDAGHLLGSAAIHLKIEEGEDIKTFTFSGDVGRYRNVLLKSPTEFPQADYIVLESTYGDSLHELTSSTPDKLLQFIKTTCLQKKGKLIIPAFSVGRTQELLFALNQLELENRLPELNYFVDSPLSIKATEIVKHFPGYFKGSVQKIMELDSDPFAFKGLKYVRVAEESKMLLDYEEPCVIIASSGMADAGRIRFHICNTIEAAENTILLVGHCDPDSLGGELLSGAEGVYIMGDAFEVKAEIAQIRSLSAHGDYNDLLQFVACQDAAQVKKLFLVHGEYKIQQQLKHRLQLKGFDNVEIPGLHEEVELDVVEEPAELVAVEANK
jgi:metallo-beta-lactamase family protein